MKKWLKKTIKNFQNPAPVVPVVRLEGVIATSSRYQEALNLQTIGQELTKAFEMEKAKAVAIVVNSPGGSPSHSLLVHDRIRLLAQKHDKTVLVFVEEVAASGGYWIACAGDEVFALPTSIVGSIGVIAASFGFEAALEKLGISRRLYTAGEKKSLLDPFLPEKPEDVARLKAVQGALHEQFQAHVRTRRAGKLVEEQEGEIFSGAFWLGQGAQEYGLIDDIGELYAVLQDRYGTEVKMPELSKGKSWMRELLGMRSARAVFPSVGMTPDRWASAVEYRAVLARSLSRFGL